MPALVGHSDGDAVLHAVADALLGAAGLGDIGGMFPPGEAATRGADSRGMLAAIAAALGAEPGCVGVKGKTNEGLDAVGRGEAVAAHAVALVRRAPPDRD